MLDWIGETILAIFTSVPAVFTAEHSPQFMLVRAMFALLFITLIVYLIAMRPFRGVASRWARAVSQLFERKS